MSRCFPFPPPGYEKKPRQVEDLFQEEKGREKKHKKEKKAKRKREGDYKEEGNIDRVKQKEKKEKRDKHRGKKEKEKIKSKDRDKKSISDDATTAGKPETSGRDYTHTVEECSNSKSRGLSENKFASALGGQNGWSITNSRHVRDYTAGKPETSRLDRDNTDTIEECSNSKSCGLSENKFSSALRGQNGWSITDTRHVNDNTAGRPETSGRVNTRTIEECSNSKSCGLSENKFASALRGQNGWSITDNRHVKESEESKFVEELGRRIKDEGKAIGSRTTQRSSTSDRRRYKEMHRFAVTSLQNLEHGKDEGVNPQKVEGKIHKKVEDKGLEDGLQFNGNNTVQNLTVSIDRKVEMPPEPVQRVVEKPVRDKDKCKEKSDSKRGEKRKDRHKKEKKSHGKDKGRDEMKIKKKHEEKKREEMEKETNEHKKRDQDSSKDLYRNEHSSSSKDIDVYISRVDNKIVSTEENVKKVKDVEANGFVHVNDIQSNRLRTQLMNNGKILEACQSSSLLDSNRLCIPVQDTVLTKYHELNGTLGPQSSYMPKKNLPSEPTTRSDQQIEALQKPQLTDKVVEASRELPQAPVVVDAFIKGPLAGNVIETSRKAPQASRIVDSLNKHGRADRITGSSRKPPHPDLKYLSKVLSVPKMEVWSEVDDQEWLFSSKDLPLEKQKYEVSVDSGQPHVWSETLYIESADLYALPYVIPY